MAITRKQKESIVEKLQDIIREMNTLVFVNFKGVTAEEAHTIRGACISEEVGYIVAKKTLIKKAFENTSIQGTLPPLKGEVAIAYSRDVVASARVVKNSGKELDDRLTILGGVFENAFIPQEEMQAIADIPSLETLYAQLLTVIQAPVRGFASVLSQVAEKKTH